MSKPSNADRAAKIVNLWQSYHDSPIRLGWLDRAITDEEYFFGFQISDERMDAMVANRLVAAVKNRIAPPARQLKAELSTRAPAGKVTTTSGVNTDISTIFSGIIKHIEYISKRPVQIARVSHQMVCKGGIGWAMPIIDPLSSDGKGDIYIKQIPNDNVYVAPTVCDIPTCKDAPEIIIAKEEPLEYAIRKNPKLKDRLSNGGKNFDPQRKEGDGRSFDNEVLKVGATKQGNQQQGKSFDTAFKIERYQLEQRDRWFVDNPKTGQQYITFDSEALSVPEKIANFFDNVTRTKINPVTRCKVTHLYAPDIWVTEEWMDIDRYPMVPFIAEDTGNLFPFGLVWFARQEQDLLNKFESMRIQYIQLSMHGKIILDKSATKEDKAEVRKNFAKIGVPLELEYNADGTPMFTVYQPTVIPEAFILDAARAENGIKNAMGIFNQDMGNPEGAPRTFAATQSMHAWGKEKRRGMLDLFNISLEQLYDNIVALIPVVYNKERVLSYLDDEMVPQTLKLNKKEYVDQAWQKLSSITNGLTNETKGSYFDVSELQAQFKIIPDSFLPTDRMAMLQLMGELYQNSKGNPIFLKEMLRFLDVPNRAELIQQVDIVPQLQQALQKAQGTIKQLVSREAKAIQGEINYRQAAVTKEHETRQAIATKDHKVSLEQLYMDAENQVQDMLRETEFDLKEIELQKRFSTKMLSQGNGTKG